MHRSTSICVVVVLFVFTVIGCGGSDDGASSSSSSASSAKRGASPSDGPPPPALAKPSPAESAATVRNDANASTGGAPGAMTGGMDNMAANPMTAMMAAAAQQGGGGTPGAPMGGMEGMAGNPMAAMMAAAAQQGGGGTPGAPMGGMQGMAGNPMAAMMAAAAQQNPGGAPGAPMGGMQGMAGNPMAAMMAAAAQQNPGGAPGAPMGGMQGMAGNPMAAMMAAAAQQNSGGARNPMMGGGFPGVGAGQVAGGGQQGGYSDPAVPEWDESYESPLGGLMSAPLEGVQAQTRPNNLPTYGGGATGGFPGATGGFPGALSGNMPAAQPKPLTLKEKAAVAVGSNDEKTAFDYLYAAALADDDTDLLKKYRWSNALKRPLVAVRWGLGAHVTISPRNYEGSFHPLGSTQSIPDKATRRSNRGSRRGGGFGGGDAGALGNALGSLPTMGSGGSSYSSRSNSAGTQALADAAGELSDELIAQLREHIEDADYGEVLVELASAMRQSRNRGGGGYPGSGFPGAGMAGGGNALMDAQAMYTLAGMGMEGPGMLPSGGALMPGLGGLPGYGAASDDSADQLTSVVPGLIVFGRGSSKKLLNRAEKQGVDVLGIFETEVAQNRKTGLVVNKTHLVLWDVRRQEEIFRTKSLNNITVQKARDETKGDDDAEFEDPVDMLLDQLFEDLSSNTEPLGAEFAKSLKLRAFPDAIRPEHVKSRIGALLAGDNPGSLPVLAEIKYYHSRKLIDDATLTKSFQEVLGEEDGAKLAKGKEDERVEVVNGLLPEAS